MPNLVTNKFKIHNAEQFIESLSESSATNLYLLLAKLDAWSDETDPPAPTDSIANSSFDYWRSMISAKKITSADVSHIIPKLINPILLILHIVKKIMNNLQIIFM